MIPHDENADHPRSRAHEQQVSALLNSLLRRLRVIDAPLQEFDLGYTPETPANWPSLPTTVWDALDELAAAVLSSRPTAIHGRDGEDGEDGMTIPGKDGITQAQLGGLITDTTIASPISSGAQGSLQLTTDSPYMIEADGSNLNYHGPIQKLTPPVDSDFSWVNQGGATVATTNGGVYITAPVDAGTGPNFRIRTKSAPATPYTLTVLYLADNYPASFLTTCIGFRESATGKLETLEVVYSSGSGGFLLAVQNYSSPTVFNATRSFIKISDIGLPIWTRLVADGTNISFQWSTSGFGFQTLAQVAKNAYFTTAPDQIFFAAQSDNTTYQAKGHFIHWREQ